MDKNGKDNLVRTTKQLEEELAAQRALGASLLRQSYNRFNELIGREDKHFLESSTFVFTPVGAAIVSYILYPKTACWFHDLVNYLSNNNWEPVDGGTLQWSILLPALNGVVMTAISLLYANMISTTGTQLRSRQMTIHSSLSQEVEGLQALIQLIAYYPENCRAQFANFIQGYLQVLVEETDPNKDNDMELRANSLPLSKYRDGLHTLGMQPSSPGSINGNVLERSYESLSQLIMARNARITSTQTKFPDLHYMTITALSAVILLVFMLETDRKVILFLDKFQIRLVWGLLVGTITAIYCIGIDLAQPFIGTYTVPAEQLLEDNLELLVLIQSGAQTPALVPTNTATSVAEQQMLEDKKELLAFLQNNGDQADAATPALPTTPSSTRPDQEELLAFLQSKGQANDAATPMLPTNTGTTTLPTSAVPTTTGTTTEQLLEDHDGFLAFLQQNGGPPTTEVSIPPYQEDPGQIQQQQQQQQQQAQGNPMMERPPSVDQSAAAVNGGTSLYDEYMRGRNQ